MATTKYANGSLLDGMEWKQTPNNVVFGWESDKLINDKEE